MKPESILLGALLGAFLYVVGDLGREFAKVYKLYRWGGRRYALRAAWRIAVRRIPF